ncbi:MAG: hypothetical protein APR63_00615 [Desulfuromonas sp. SDB]|nr:MAG: hypothetical protein APR63_00615 [Desulfuromonas sp. SDB]
MRKLLLVLPLIAFMLVFGCTKDDSNPTGPGGGGPAAPTNVTIQTTNDGLGIIITWTAVANADSYMVQTPDADVTVAGNQTTYTDNAPANMGIYRVRAYDDNTAGDWSSSHSTTPEYGYGIQIGEWTHSTTWACYYWDANGNGHLMSSQIASGYDPALVDIFLYDNNTNNFYFYGGQTAPTNPGYKNTYLAEDIGGTYITYAPPEGNNYWKTGTQNPLNTTTYYWVELENGHYVRLSVTSLAVGPQNKDVIFSWWWQPVQGFRYVE